jgi:hypothetical protein
MSMILAQSFASERVRSLAEGTNLVLRDKRTLVSPDYLNQLASFYRGLQLPRREIPNWIADKLASWEGGLSYDEIFEFSTDDESIDRAFNHEGSFRWISDFVKFSDEKPKQKAQYRIMDRLLIMSAAAAIDEYRFLLYRREVQSWFFMNRRDMCDPEFDINHSALHQKFFEQARPAQAALGTDQWANALRMAQAFCEFTDSDESSWVYDHVIDFFSEPEIRRILKL